MAGKRYPTGWDAASLRQDSSWIIRLGQREAQAFSTALLHAKASEKDMLSMTCDDFPLDESATEVLARAIDATQTGRGVCLLKGFPVDEWTEDEAKLVAWGIGLHSGVLRTQNKESNFLASVRDTGNSYRAKGGRGYNTHAALDFHVDKCDIVGLLTLQTAKEGGQSKIVSSIAVCDEIRARDANSFDILELNFYHSHQGAQAAGEPPVYRCPIFGEEEGYFCCYTNRKNLVAAQRDFPEVPRLSCEEIRALDLLEEVMIDDRFCFGMWLERGDLQLLNNHIVVHSRTEFRDQDDFNKRRHLVRLWLSVPQSQPLPSTWKEYIVDTRAGAVRGGWDGSYLSTDFLKYEKRQAEAMGMALMRRRNDIPS